MTRMRLLCVVLSALALLGRASAQCNPTPLFAQTLPGGYETVDGNYTLYAVGLYGGGPFNANTSGSRWQWTYARTEFYHQCPILITQIRMRRSSDANLTGATYPNVNIVLASSNNGHTMMAQSFASNLGSDQITVYSGPVTIPVHTGMAVNPAPWLVTIPFTTAFAYDPTRLRDLVIDLQVLPPIATTGTFFLDGVFPHPGVSQNGHATDPNSPIRNIVNPDAGPILEIQYHLGAPNHFNLIACTTPGIGDLYYEIANIPAGTTEGFTLVTGTPSVVAPVPAPFGRGPIFGIYPDPFTFGIFLGAPNAGDLFHWAYPGGGLFPDIPVVGPPGALLVLVGQTWEAVAIALGPNFSVLGISPPRQLIW